MILQCACSESSVLYLRIPYLNVSSAHWHFHWCQKQRTHSSWSAQISALLQGTVCSAAKAKHCSRFLLFLAHVCWVLPPNCPSDLFPFPALATGLVFTSWIIKRFWNCLFSSQSFYTSHLKWLFWIFTELSFLKWIPVHCSGLSRPLWALSLHLSS